MTCRRRARGPRVHHCSWQHRELVEGYRLARAAQLQRAESWSLGYGAELVEFWRDVERPLTFRAWLEGSRDSSRAAWQAAA